jgi:hypothetical protein
MEELLQLKIDCAWTLYLDLVLAWRHFLFSTNGILTFWAASLRVRIPETRKHRIHKKYPVQRFRRKEVFFGLGLGYFRSNM